jgi:TonB family protein
MTPPRQTGFEPAVYPEAAKRAGLEAKVVLRLSIDADGHVTNAEVEKGAGHGFDEAAQAAAERFRFEPAMRNKKPVGSVILYEYRFTLTPVVEKPAARTGAPDGDGLAKVRVRLTAIDAPVTGGTISLQRLGGHRRDLTTDGRGEVQFPDVAPGRYRVSISAPGFRPLDVEESFDADSDTRLRYGLEPLNDSIEVRVRGEVQRDVTVRKVSREEFTLVPGGSGDPIRVVESLPGTARTSDGSLVIRGASPFLSGVLLDGMAIPFLYHNYQITSVVPADVVDSVTLYPGNFGVRYGRYTGGIVEVGLRQPNTQCTLDYGKPSSRTGCYHGLLQLDLIEGRAMVQGPIPGARRWSFAVSARKSWLDFVMKQAVKQTDLYLERAPRYYDGYVMADYRGEKERFSLRAIASRDELAVLVQERAAEDVTEVGRFEYEYGFERLQAVYQKDVSESLSLSSMLGVGRDYITLIANSLHFKQRSVPIAFRHEFRGKPASWLDLNVGVDLLTAPYSLDINIPQQDALVPSKTKTLHGTDATFGVFTEAVLRPSERIEVLPGARVDHSPLFSETTVSPRLLARYRLVDRPGAPWFTRTTLKAGAGLYHQAPPILVRYFDDRTNQHSLRTQQYSVGFEQELVSHLDLSAEGFLIDRKRLFSVDPDDEGSSHIGNRGTGKSVGLEAFLRYHSNQRFFGWVAYTMMRSVERDSPEDPEHPAQFDQRHNLILVGSLDLGRGWRIGARFRYVSGNPVTDIVSPPRAPSVFDGQTGNVVPQYTNVNAARMPDVHQLDLRLDRRFDYRLWALTVYLDIRNVYNHRVVDYYAYNWDFTKREAVQGLPLLPNLGVKGEF